MIKLTKDSKAKVNRQWQIQGPYMHRYYSEKERDLTHSYDKIPPIPTENKKSQLTTQKATKISITQRLRTDLG